MVRVFAQKLISFNQKTNYVFPKTQFDLSTNLLDDHSIKKSILSETYWNFEKTFLKK